MVQIHILTADTSVELMERANAVPLAELQAQFCTIEDVKFSRMGSTRTPGALAVTLGVLILYNTPVEQGCTTRALTPG